MANWHYYNKNGEKVGPITVAALKALTAQGLITRETVLANHTGRTLMAGEVNGLTFPESSQKLEAVSLDDIEPVSISSHDAAIGNRTMHTIDAPAETEVYGVSAPEVKPEPPTEAKPFAAMPSVSVPPPSTMPPALSIGNPLPVEANPFTVALPETSNPFTAPAPTSPFTAPVSQATPTAAQTPQRVPVPAAKTNGTKQLPKPILFAGIGIVSLLLLIGGAWMISSSGESSGSPASQKQQAFRGTPEQKQMLAAYHEMKELEDELQEDRIHYGNLSLLCKLLRGIDVSMCPSEFRHAFQEYVDAQAEYTEAMRLLQQDVKNHEIHAQKSRDAIAIIAKKRDRVGELLRQYCPGQLKLANKPRSFIKLVGHHEATYSATFSPDGKRIATIGKDSNVRIWDAETGTELKNWLAYNKNSVAFSPDGTKIVTAGDFREAHIWDAESGKELKKLEGHTQATYYAAFSPDGKKIATASDDKSARIWDVESGKELRKLDGHTDTVYSVAFSPDGKKIVTASQNRFNTHRGDKTARIWDVASGKELKKLEGHMQGLNFAAFSPDGKKIVTASWDNTAIVWDVESGKELHKLATHTNKVHSAVFSPDGKKIVTTSWDKTTKIWDADSGKELKELVGNRFAWVYSAAFSPDGKKIVTTGSKAAWVFTLE